MKLELWVVGKERSDLLADATQDYASRIRKMVPFELITIAASQLTEPAQRKEKEYESVLAKLDTKDILVLFDEAGELVNSKQFARQLELQLSSGKRRIIFLVAGAYGADDRLKARADRLVSFSRMTMSHSLARLSAAEQIYRAFTIIRNIPYHND